MLSSSDSVTGRGVREIVLRPFRPDYVVRPELHLQRATPLDPKPVQVYLRSLLADVCRGAHVTPDCDDVGHLPTHTGNYVSTVYNFVRSYHEPPVFLRVAVLRCVRSNHHRANQGASQR